MSCPGQESNGSQSAGGCGIQLLGSQNNQASQNGSQSPPSHTHQNGGNSHLQPNISSGVMSGGPVGSGVGPGGGGSSSSAKATLNVQTEKPIHYTYLKEFRVEQCPQFQQHKCTQHKPFTCFHWHFNNQRRRRPIRDPKTKTFNYSPDMYCNQYDETTGNCPDGDECLYLHRTAGDTERRYHLRYYKTGICVYDTDARGHCVKNGPHCAFAHGLHDLRNPVYDIREIQGKMLNEDGTEIDANGVLIPNSLDKDRNAVSEDPRWQDTNYVLGNYKTEPCKRPPRLCRQGYACPQYHNSRDKRRPPNKFKYRSTPCPNVKQGDEWGDPANCESGDQCTYCHTRTEQQFHPEIYKSTKCNDMQQTSFCPRGPFCAFAHVDKEMSAVREMSSDATSLSAILSNVLPQSTSPTSNKVAENGCMDVVGSVPSSSSFGNIQGPIGRPRSYSTSHAAAVQHHLQLKTMESALPHYQKAPGCEREEVNAMRKHRAKTMDGAAANKDWAALANYNYSNTVESVVGKALDDLNLEDIDVEACLDKELLLEECNPVASSLTQGLANSGFINTSQPVNIPGRDRPHSPSASLVGSIDKGAQAAFYGSPLINSANFVAAATSYAAAAAAGASQSPSANRLWPEGPNNGGQCGNSAGNNGNLVPPPQQQQQPPQQQHSNSWTEGQMAQIRAVCEVYKNQADEALRREKLIEQQRDDALSQLQKLQMELQQIPFSSMIRSLDLDRLTMQQIRALQEQLRTDLDALDKLSNARISQAAAAAAMAAMTNSGNHNAQSSGNGGATPHSSLNGGGHSMGGSSGPGGIFEEFCRWGAMTNGGAGGVGGPLGGTGPLGGGQQQQQSHGMSLGPPTSHHGLSPQQQATAGQHRGPGAHC